MESDESRELTGDEPIELGEGKKPELEPVVPDDIDKIGKFNKDALRTFAVRKFGFNLDLSLHIAIIRGDLVKKCMINLGMMLQDKDTNDEVREAIEKVIPMYMKNPKNGRVFDSTPDLLKRTDLIPCTKEGRPLRSNEYFIPQPKPAYKKDSRSEMERMAAGMESQIRDDV